MRVVFHPEAHAEMIEQARYYEANLKVLAQISLMLASGYLPYRLLQKPANAEFD